MSLSHWGMFEVEALMFKGEPFMFYTNPHVWAQKPESLPYWNCRFEGDMKTFGEHAREALGKWAEKH